MFGIFGKWVSGSSVPLIDPPTAGNQWRNQRELSLILLWCSCDISGKPVWQICPFELNQAQLVQVLSQLVPALRDYLGFGVGRIRLDVFGFGSGFISGFHDTEILIYRGQVQAHLDRDHPDGVALQFQRAGQRRAGKFDAVWLFCGEFGRFAALVRFSDPVRRRLADSIWIIWCDLRYQQKNHPFLERLTLTRGNIIPWLPRLCNKIVIEWTWSLPCEIFRHGAVRFTTFDLWRQTNIALVITTWYGFWW